MCAIDRCLWAYFMLYHSLNIAQEEEEEERRKKNEEQEEKKKNIAREEKASRHFFSFSFVLLRLLSVFF